MSVYKLYAAGSGGTENNAASLDVQFEGKITAILMSSYGDFDAADESLSVEVSFLSTATFTSNDARGSLAMNTMSTGVVTSGANNGGRIAVSGINIPVNAGERLHLHISSTAGVVSQNQAYIYVDDGSDPNLRRRR